jgi:hypothetical protein
MPRRRAPRAATLLALSVAALLGIARPRTGWADSPDPVTLTWTAPAECPSEDDVRKETLRLLAGPPIGADRRVAAVAHVMRLASGRWRVDVSMSSAKAQGKRSLEAGTCPGLADATALIVAIMVDPARAEAAASASAASSAPAPPSAPASAPASASAPAPSSAPPPLPAEQPTPAPPSSFAPRWAAGAAGLVDSSTLPAPAFGAALAVSATVWRIRSDVAASLLPGRTYTQSSARGTLGADMSAWMASVDVAYEIPVRRMKIDVGAGAELTDVTAIGVAASAPVVGVPAHTTWASLRAGGALTAPVFASLFARLTLDAVVPLRRPAFVIDPVGTVSQSSPVTARLGAGVEVHF